MIAVYNIAGDRPHNLTAFIIYITIFKSLSEFVLSSESVVIRRALHNFFFSDSVYVIHTYNILPMKTGGLYCFVKQCIIIPAMHTLISVIVIIHSYWAFTTYCL